MIEVSRLFHLILSLFFFNPLLCDLFFCSNYKWWKQLISLTPYHFYDPVQFSSWYRLDYGLFFAANNLSEWLINIVLIIRHICSKLKSGSRTASSFTVEYISAGNASSIIVVKRSVETVSSKTPSSSRIWFISDIKISESLSGFITLLSRRRIRVLLRCRELFLYLLCKSSQACFPSPGLQYFGSSCSNTLRAVPVVVNLKTLNRYSFAGHKP